MWTRRSLCAALIAACWCASPRACGPDFPQELLATRAQTLLGMSEGNFAFEVSHLVVPADALRANESVPWDSTPELQRDAAEQAGLDATQVQTLAAARSAPDAARAYEAGDGLPLAVRHYVAGAIAFQRESWEEARAHFSAILTLPDDERRARGVWAAWMLGRVETKTGEADAALAAFERARRLAIAGDADPLGLAVASHGETARVALDRGAIGDAMASYAEQAARGSAGGATSLLFVARRLVADPALASTALDDPIAQRVLVAYAFSRANELAGGFDYGDGMGGEGGYADPSDEAFSDEDAAGDAIGSATDTTTEASSADVALEAEPDPDIVEPIRSERLDALLDLIAARDAVAGKDRLAAVAYRAGRFDLATKLAAGETSPLAAWLRAKLALRAGDATTAAREYAAASAAFPADESWTSSTPEEDYGIDTVKPACRIAGEQGALALSRGEYTDAMRQLYRAADEYWNDAAYVAERVLTTEELRAFVDVEAPSAPVPVKAENGDESKALKLRRVLARRLLREDRRADALAYFDDAETKAQAQSYVDARNAADRAKGIDAAQRWWQAATSAREHGMTLLGYELDPDYRVYDGMFDLNAPGHWDDATSQWIEEPRHDLVIAGAYTSDDERARLAKSVASPLSRFHYRGLATQFAERAADHVPARAQAFAAMLCTATGWVLDDEPGRAGALWRRYVKEGPYVPWAANFGRQCEAPDFVGAQARADLERQRERRRMARRAAPYVAVVVGLGVALGGFAWWRRRRS